jgi:peptide/nickel transport system permease protein
MAFLRKPTTLVYLPVMAVIVGFVVLGPLLAPSPILAVFPTMQAPGWEHLMGTDDLGRDYFARVAGGGRISLVIGFSVALLCLTLGLIIGGIAGYYGGILDLVFVKITEFFQVLPAILLALVGAALFGKHPGLIVIILALTMWPAVARIVRAEAMRIAQLGYVESARAVGFHGLRIIWSDVIPNLMPPVLVATTLTVGRAILIESGLSYVGLGDPSNPSWGTLLSLAQSHMRMGWWLAVIPGMFIFLVVLAVNMLGDALNDAFNPLIGRVK